MEEVYLHIGNGGVTFRAGTDKDNMLGIEVTATHFGNTTQYMHIHTDAESMRKIGEMLIAASEQTHEVYCCAAEAQKETENSALSASEML
ncbi:hypothetical protein MHH28_07725 [Paenibacillus sp. FSL K6-1217]|uniref:hypothetical protein n=1 Tax=Paenibacillus sp. FSL K6-1217 TaxID=2921466 RepID=UPI00324EB5A9